MKLNTILFLALCSFDVRAIAFSPILPKEGVRMDYSCKNLDKITYTVLKSKTETLEMPTLSDPVQETLKKVVPEFPAKQTVLTQNRIKSTNDVTDYIYSMAQPMWVSYGDILRITGSGRVAGFPAGGSLLSAKKIKSGETYTLYYIETKGKEPLPSASDQSRLMEINLAVGDASEVSIGDRKIKTVEVIETRKVLAGYDPYESIAKKFYAYELGILTRFDFKFKDRATGALDCALTRLFP